MTNLGTLFDSAAQSANGSTCGTERPTGERAATSGHRNNPQTYTMAPENPEILIRNAALDALEGRYGSLLDWLRQRMVQVYLHRRAAQGQELAYVTADDARLILDADPNVPPPDRLNRNFLGQLFRSPGWIATGQLINSRTPGSHGNLLRCWRWEGNR